MSIRGAFISMRVSAVPIVDDCLGEYDRATLISFRLSDLTVRGVHSDVHIRDFVSR